MSGTEIPPECLDPRFSVRPIPRVFRSDKIQWEISLEGQKIGYLEQVSLGRHNSVFFKAFGYFPGTGEAIALELSPSFEERCQVLASFAADPDSSVHLPDRLRQKPRPKP